MRHFLSLPPELRAKVALAVLLDGVDAKEILRLHTAEQERLEAAASEIFSASPDVRLPVLGTLLREALYGVAIQEVDQTRSGYGEEPR